MCIDKGLKLKAHNIAVYLINRFNADFNKDNINTFKLSVKEAYNDNGYIIYFDNKKIYYDIHILPRYEEKGRNRIRILGTYYFFLLNEKTSKNDYYYYFLHIIQSLFKHQKEYKDVYGCCPHCLFEINKMIENFKHVNVLV